jgi:hypothetical protein
LQLAPDGKVYPETDIHARVQLCESPIELASGTGGPGPQSSRSIRLGRYACRRTRSALRSPAPS